MWNTGQLRRSRYDGGLVPASAELVVDLVEEALGRGGQVWVLAEVSCRGDEERRTYRLRGGHRAQGLCLACRLWERPAGVTAVQMAWWSPPPQWRRRSAAHRSITAVKVRLSEVLGASWNCLGLA